MIFSIYDHWNSKQVSDKQQGTIERDWGKYKPQESLEVGLRHHEYARGALPNTNSMQSCYDGAH